MIGVLRSDSPDEGDRSPSQDSYHPDDLFQSRYATPGFKPFSYLRVCVGLFFFFQLGLGLMFCLFEE